MIDERHVLLAVLVPALGVLLLRIIEIGVGAKRDKHAHAPHPLSLLQARCRAD